MSTPQIPFISVPVKKTDDIDWIHPLKKYIARVYQDDPEKYKEETQSFNRLRQDIRGAGKDLTGRDLFYRYFGQLELLDLRFPVDEKHVKILFNWYDTFNSKPVAQYSLAFEKASVIFNLAATLSAIASMQNRAEAEGRKRAFHYFQASAGMFQYINDNFLHAPSEDLSRETVNMLSELMLAQAHECFLETSIKEKNKSGLIAKLASHAAWVYGNLVDSMTDATVRGVNLDKSWVIITQIKQKYYTAMAQSYKAAACEAESKYGESVSRYGAAEAAAKEANKLCSQALNNQLIASNHANGTVPADSGSVLQELCKSILASAGEKFTVATRDNDLIYHENVPQESILTPIDRLKTVRPIPISELYGPEEMKKVIGVDIFNKLIPLSIHESASMYSEEKAKLVRMENERCDIAKAELNASLDYMKLPSSLAKFKQQSSLDSYASPSQEVRAWADELAAEEHPPIHELISKLFMQKRTVGRLLEESSLALSSEMKEYEQERVNYGDQWTQSPSGMFTNEFVHDISNHRRTLDNAGVSDNQLIAKYESMKHTINILKQGSQSRDLEKAYAECISAVAGDSQDTSINLLDVDINAEEESKQSMAMKVKNIEMIIDKLRKIDNDRTETFRDLKEKTLQDDISQLLILNKKANVEQQIFSSELEKFKPHQQRITATIQHQQQTIQDLTEAFKELMEGEEAKTLYTKHEKAERLQHNLNNDFREARTVYADLRHGLRKGLEFYNNLEEAVQSLKHNIDKFCADRANERHRLKQEIETSKSSREQAQLREELNKYTAPNINQLTNQTRQMSIHNEPSAPFAGYTPTPPPKPFAPSTNYYGYRPPTPAHPPVPSHPPTTPPQPPASPYSQSNYSYSNYSNPSYNYRPTPPSQPSYNTQPPNYSGNYTAPSSYQPPSQPSTYQPPAQSPSYQPPASNYQPPSQPANYQPSSAYQPPSNNYQPPTPAYQPPSQASTYPPSQSNYQRPPSQSSSYSSYSSPGGYPPVYPPSNQHQPPIPPQPNTSYPTNNYSPNQFQQRPYCPPQPSSGNYNPSQPANWRPYQDPSSGNLLD
ncbi:BRO1-like domain-containing protein [Pilobolus umbonatus]|nr:BRO1-like domain-containing protein [Pilobolus umbonatus]